MFFVGNSLFSLYLIYKGLSRIYNLLLYTKGNKLLRNRIFKADCRNINIPRNKASRHIMEPAGNMQKAKRFFNETHKTSTMNKEQTSAACGVQFSCCTRCSMACALLVRLGAFF